MALRSLICPSCGGQIDSFDERSQKGFCPFCGSLIANVPELQNQFLTDSQGRVVVSGIEGSDELFDRIQANIRFGDTYKAQRLASEFTEKYPTQFRGWRARYEIALPDVRDKMVTSTEVETALDRMRILASTPEEYQYLAAAKTFLQQRRNTVSAELASAQSQLPGVQQAADAANAAFRQKSSKGAKSTRPDRDNDDRGVIVAVVGSIVGWIALASIGFLGPGLVILGGLVIGAGLGKLVSSTGKQRRAQYSADLKVLGEQQSSANAALDQLTSRIDECNRFLPYLDRIIAQL